MPRFWPLSSSKRPWPKADFPAILTWLNIELGTRSGRAKRCWATFRVQNYSDKIMRQECFENGLCERYDKVLDELQALLPLEPQLGRDVAL